MGNQSRISSKWTKTRVMSGSSLLASHIPETRKLTGGSLAKLMNRYGMIYVKPDTGSLGVGVMKIARSGGRWTVRTGTRRKTFASFRQMYAWLRTRTKGRRYLAQRGIRMIGLGKRPADFRVMIQRGRKAGWRMTGVAARVAHPGKAVTNGSQGGSIYAADALLRRSFGTKKAASVRRKFRALARATAGRLSGAYPRMNELGLDVAVDRKGRCWILEVNTSPDPCPFTKLEDASMLRRIIRFARGYGRTYRLKCLKARSGR